MRKALRGMGDMRMTSLIIEGSGAWRISKELGTTYLNAHMSYHSKFILLHDAYLMNPNKEIHSHPLESLTRRPESCARWIGAEKRGTTGTSVPLGMTRPITMPERLTRRDRRTQKQKTTKTT